MTQPRRNFLGALVAAGCSAGLNFTAQGAVDPVLPAGLAGVIAGYGEVTGSTSTPLGLEVRVRVHSLQHLAEGFGNLCRFGKVRAMGNELRIESTVGRVLIRHQA